MNKITANSKPKAKPRGKPWPKGVSGNPAGAPKRGESWAEIIKEFGDMTPVEISERVTALARDLRQYGSGATMKQAVIARVYAALMYDPQPGLLNSFMDRTDGKVTVPVDVTTDGDKITKVEFDYGKLIGSIAPRPEEDPETPSQDESSVHGEAMGKDNTGGNVGTGSG
jgi:hypothetical protein